MCTVTYSIKYVTIEASGELSSFTSNQLKGKSRNRKKKLMCNRRWALSSFKKKKHMDFKDWQKIELSSDWKDLSTLDFLKMIEILNFEKLSPVQFLISFILTYCLFFSFRKILFLLLVRIQNYNIYLTLILLKVYFYTFEQLGVSICDIFSLQKILVVLVDSQMFCNNFVVIQGIESIEQKLLKAMDAHQVMVDESGVQQC